VDLAFSHSEAAVLREGGSVGVLEAAVTVVDRVRAWEQLRELGVFLASRRLDVERDVEVPLGPAEGKDGEEDEEAGEEEEEEGGGDGAAASKKTTRTIRVRTLTSDLLDAFSGTAAEREALVSTLHAGTEASVDAATYVHALTIGRSAVRNALVRVIRDYSLDAIAYPSALAPAAAVRGAGDAGVWVRGTLAAADEVYGQNAALATVAGAPAVSVPCGLAHLRPSTAPGNPGSERVPVGFELCGKPGSDPLLLKLAASIHPLFPAVPDPVIRRKWTRGVRGSDPL
jgi:Asp-tRNA(Asn)/Glu-tRNA(Gln) amidotransferase A subunit family amidase